MNESAKTSNQITEGVIWKQLLLFFFPLLFGTFFQMLYNTTDTIIVGRFIGTTALSAIGGAPAMIINLLIGALTGLSSGATVIIAQFYGAGEKKHVSDTVHTAVGMALILGAAAMIFGMLMARRLLVAMNTPQDALEESVTYLTVYFAGMIPNIFYNTGAGILRAIGDSRRPLFFLVVSCLTNIVLDILFVPVLGMGVMGAALATILCQTLAAALVLAVLMKSRESYRLEPAKIRISREYLRRILKIGIPAMLQSMTYSVTNVILQVVVNGFGTAYVAGWAACAKGDQLFWMLTQSFGIAVTTFVGQNYGAGHYQRVRKCIRQGFLIETILTLTCVAFLWTATGLILSLFTTDKEVFDLAFGMMHFFIPCYVTWICNEIISSTLRGLGDSIFPMIISISGVCVFRIVWVLTAVRIWPQFRTIMLSYPISWVLTSILLVLYFSLVWMRSGRLKGIERPAGQKAPVW